MEAFRVGVLGMGLVLFSIAVAAQSPDDGAWKEFLAWLQVAPPASGVLEIIQGYQRDLRSKGIDPLEADRRLNSVLRLMRERTDAWPLMFDRIYASPTPNFSTKPNALLMAAIEGRGPGRALDVGMGQGRNAIALAARGWQVTGFDVSAEGLAVAKAEAARHHVTITVVQQGDAEFDYGVNQWDLIAIVYGPGAVERPDYVERLSRALRPGGLVVVESFASDTHAARRRPVDIDPSLLLKAFATFRILRFEDTDGVTDWDPQSTTLVRLVAQKR
jgi:SAM-dependent methyltransferase